MRGITTYGRGLNSDRNKRVCHILLIRVLNYKPSFKGLRLHNLEIIPAKGQNIIPGSYLLKFHCQLGDFCYTSLVNAALLQRHTSFRRKFSYLLLSTELMQVEQSTKE